MERTSESGLAIDPVYDDSKLTDFRPAEKLGQPREYPFTRGVYRRMYVDPPWTMRQYAGFAEADQYAGFAEADQYAASPRRRSLTAAITS